jgi:uncharacterized protein YdiU (UPF0061 family)
MDYTNTFWDLSQDIGLEDSLKNRSDFIPWLEKWRYTIDNSCGMQEAKELMKMHNPVYIPRNHLFEQALEEAVNGNLSLFKKLLGIVSNPYQYQNAMDKYMAPSDSDFERSYQTFCGT